MSAASSAPRAFAIGASRGGARSLVAPQAVAQDRTADIWSDLHRLASVLRQAPATKAA